MSEALEPTKHWRLSPSGSHRWLNCPASAVEDLPSEQNVHTIRGHKLHSRAAFGVTHGLPVFGGHEDAEAVRAAIRATLELPGEIHIEQPIESAEIADFGGTIDVLAIYDDTLHVLDYKFGRRRVHARDNTQLQCYLTLGREKHPGATKFKATIVQPAVRKKPVTADYTAKQLDHHKAAIAMAAASETIQAGDWCRFCPLLAGCSAGQQQMRSNL